MSYMRGIPGRQAFAILAGAALAVASSGVGVAQSVSPAKAPPQVRAQCTAPSPLVSRHYDYNSPGQPEVLVLENGRVYVIPAMAFGSMVFFANAGDPIEACQRVPGRKWNVVGGRCSFVYNAATGDRAELCPPQTPKPAPIGTP
jgi:hypothetical protein